jgi:hypothetical protein
MILRSPAEFLKKLGSRKAEQAMIKFNQHKHLWALAEIAMKEADPEFAAKYTAMAVTYGFQGSPHIDKQNVGPFYGLSLGDFPDGEGGVCVEVDARTVAHVNTKNRLGKIDGRYPHWVAPYTEGCQRYSLIFYQTEGKKMPTGTAFYEAVEPDLAAQRASIRKVEELERARAIQLYADAKRAHRNSLRDDVAWRPEIPLGHTKFSWARARAAAKPARRPKQWRW